jgi:hypothetical protein
MKKLKARVAVFTGQTLGGERDESDDDDFK